MSRTSRLYTFARDIRILRRPRRALPQKVSAARFAELLLARYRQGAAAWPRITLALRTPLRIFRATRTDARMEVRLNPRLRLTLLRWVGPTAPQYGSPVPKEVVRPSGYRPSTPSRAAPLLRRIAARTERVEGLHVSPPRRLGSIEAPAGPAADGPLGAAPLARRVPRVVRRPAEEDVPAAVRSPMGRRGALDPPGEEIASARQGAVAAQAIDVERLTNEVIGAIDRRILAERERIGRD